MNEQRGEPTLGEDDAKFLDQVADMISRSDGDPPNSEGIWALRLRAIANAIRNSVAPPARFNGEKAIADFEAKHPRPNWLQGDNETIRKDAVSSSKRDAL